MRPGLRPILGAPRIAPWPLAVLVAIVGCASHEPRAVIPPAASARTFFLGPADFEAGQVSFDLEPAPGGTSTLVIVPALTLGDERARGDLATVDFPVTIEARTIERAHSRGHPLPAPCTPAPLPPATASPAAVAPRAPAPVRTFRVGSTGSGRPVEATGRLSYVGPGHAYYDDERNLQRLDAAGYASLDAILDRGQAEIARLFGPPTDVDGDGRVIVLMSRTAVAEPPARPAHVDPCTLSADAGCGPPGEIIVSWSLDGFELTAGERAAFVDSLAATLLHESVHLSQFAAAVRAGVDRPALALPAWLREGQAQLAPFVTGVGLEASWDDLRRDLLPGGPFAAPLFQPYTTGVLPFLWARDHIGGDAQRRFIEASVDLRIHDPFAVAFGMPEGLALARTFMSLQLDGTPFGREACLDFPGDDVARRLGAKDARARTPSTVDAPPVTLHARATGHVAVDVAHAGPIHVTLSGVPAPGAYVLVARP